MRPLNKKVAKSGLEAARRKFTPEFMNRIDKVVVYKSLGEAELRRILDLELGQVQQKFSIRRLINASYLRSPTRGRVSFLRKGRT